MVSQELRELLAVAVLTATARPFGNGAMRLITKISTFSWTNASRATSSYI